MYSSSVHGCANGNDYWDDAAPLVTRLLADAGMTVVWLGNYIWPGRTDVSNLVVTMAIVCSNGATTRETNGLRDTPIVTGCLTRVTVSR
jgi:hypothetical protein